MSITASNVKARAPEFASLADATIDLFIADAALQMDSTIWADLYDLGHIYLTAHLLSSSYPSMATASGPVQQESVGQVSRTYAVGVVSSSSTGFSQSKWGRLYKQLSRLIPSRFGVT